MIDIWAILILLGAGQGLFFALILVSHPKGHRKANALFALFLAAFAFGMVGGEAYETRWILSAPQLGMVHQPLSLLLGTSMWLYICHLTGKYRVTGWQWLHFLPFVAGILWFMPFYVLPVMEKLRWLEGSYEKIPPLWKHFTIWSNAVGAVYFALILRRLYQHERNVRTVFSSTQSKTLRWVWHFILGAAAIFLICVTMSIENVAFADKFSNLFFSLLFYVMGYRALQQPEIFTNGLSEELTVLEEEKTNEQTARYEKSGLSEIKARQLLEKLEGLMRQEQLYADAELTLPQLAGRLGTSPHTLSQLLNQFQKESFFDFINRHRVEHFKQLALDARKAHLSLLALAYESGFNSKAAFNAVFKKTTGMTPSEFKNQSRP